MATLKPLDPTPRVEIPPDTMEVQLVAVEAGRSPQGLMATIHAGNGVVQVARLVRLADEADRQAFAVAVAEETLVAPVFIQQGLLDLMAGVEGALQQPQARVSDHRPSQATELASLAADAELFHTADGEAFATIKIAQHDETWPIRTRGFRQWLAREYYEVHEKTPNGPALQDALAVLEGKARYDGRECPVYTRVGEYDHRIYLDLANETWQAVEIDGTGWRVVDAPPVKFRRSRGMLSLPRPTLDGSIQELEAFVNVDGDDDWTLLVSWLVTAWRPRGPYPVLVLHGEQGAAKSTTCRVLRSLIDPNKAALRAEPRDGRDLIIAASNGWVLALDNLSHLSPWLSDALCRLSTGGGFGARELYSDQDEIIIDVQRPVIINAIEEVSTRADLLDRSIILYLPTIKREDRQTEERFWQRYEEARPRILGGLCSAVCAALGRIATVELEELPRMADYALWVTAAEAALSWEPGTFIKAYTSNREAANTLALEASPLVSPLTAIAQKGFHGTATQLLERLTNTVTDDVRRRRGWPGNGRALSSALRRLAPNLRGIGIDIVFPGQEGPSRTRLILVHSQAR